MSKPLETQSTEKKDKHKRRGSRSSPEQHRHHRDRRSHDLDPSLDHLVLVTGIKEVIMINLPSQLYHKYINNECVFTICAIFRFMMVKLAVLCNLVALYNWKGSEETRGSGTCITGTIIH